MEHQPKGAFCLCKKAGDGNAVRKADHERLKEADEVYETRGGWVIPVKQIDEASFAVNEDFVIEANHAIH